MILEANGRAASLTCMNQNSGDILVALWLFDAMTGARASPTPVSHNALERCTGHTIQTGVVRDILLLT